jgi:tRNA1(Val) A37 N6-methylase TrmN6
MQTREPTGVRLPEEPDELGALTDDAIAGDYRITQRRDGHRYSLDDVITAWEAASSAPAARLCLELGSGIGSVLLMLAYKLPEARFVAIEAQRNAFRLLERNVARNGLSSRVQLLYGDLRAPLAADAPSRFDLVTGTPPYVPPGRATPSSDAQKAYARQELRGGVEDYLAAMGRALAPDGIGVVCADARFPERVFDGAERAGLRVVRRRDVVPRARLKGPLFSLFTLRSARAAGLRYEHVAPFEARNERGERTAEYHALRAFFGISAPTHERPSP